MSKTDFHIEFHNEIPNLEDVYEQIATARLEELAGERNDMIGASVGLKELTHEETGHMYRARVVAYIRPENIVGIEKADNLDATLRGALEAVERQVRKRRETSQKPWEQTDSVVHPDNIQELSPSEIYDTYADKLEPSVLEGMSRNEIASALMVHQGLDQKAAYYAADQILKQVAA